jgi:NTE family protein
MRPSPNLPFRIKRILTKKLLKTSLIFLAAFFFLTQFSFASSLYPDSSENKNVMVGLALSGGGARGIAHIGVLMALEKENIPIDLIAGSSMGSIVGGLWASGFSGRQLKALVDQINWITIFQQSPEPRDIWLSQRYGLMEPLVRIHFQFWKISIPYGLNNGQRISEELFRKSAPANFAARSNFDSLKVPYRAMAVDVREGKVYALGSGSLAQAMRSSMAIPLLFYPALFDNKLMVDGGVLDVLPTDEARRMGADILIAVDVTEKPNPKREPANLLDIASNTIDIMIDDQMERNARLADVLIQPPIGQHPDTQYSGLDSLIDLGYQAAKQKMPEIKRLLNTGMNQKKNFPRTLNKDGLGQAKIARINIIGHKLASDNSTILTATNRIGDKPTSGFVKPGIIASYFPLKEGYLYNMDLALAGVENLYATGLFQNVWLELENSGALDVIINIHYMQLSTRTIGIGANYYSDNGANAFAQIVPFNFFGLGARFMPFLQYGELRKRAGLEIANNRFFSTAFIFNGAGYYENNSPNLYDAEGDRTDQLKYKRAIGQLSFGLQPGKKLLFNLGLRYQRVWLKENLTLSQNAVTHQYWSLYGNLLLDTRDNRYFPSRGGQLSLQGESLLNNYSAKQNYRKLLASLDWTQTIRKRHSLTPFTELGLSQNELPVYEKFRIGGPKFLPGYHREEVWVDNFFAAGVNYRFRFYKKFNFQVNWGIANIFEKRTDFQFSNFTNGMAVGLSASSPVGPVAISYGWSEKKRDQFYFSLGYNF